jgi:hypothetical protein
MRESTTLHVLLAAREQHPDAGVRAEVAAVLGDATAPAAEAIVRVEAGTLLEPFLVEEADTRLAAELFARAAAAGQGLQIVSRDKLVPDGGLVLRQAADGSVQHFYLQRVADRRTELPGDSDGLWRYVPANRPDLAAGVPLPRAEVCVSDAGVQPRVGPLREVANPSIAGAGVTDKVLSTRAPVSTLGARARLSRESDGTWLCFSAATPEDMIKLSAAMAAREWVSMPLPDGSSGAGGVVIRLEPPDGDTTPLAMIPVMARSTEISLARWARTTASVDVPGLRPGLRRAIAEWIGIPLDWITPDLLQEYA